MNTQILCLAILTSWTWTVDGQVIFLYDQQSVPSDYDTGESSFPITANQPIGQSFTPALSSVGFVRLQMYDLSPSVEVGATVYINLWSGSLGGGGVLLGSTAPIFLPSGFGHGGTSPIVEETNFFFTVPIPVTPGRNYYLQPVVESGDDIAVSGNYFTYPGGSLFVQGAVQPNESLWFREGIVVPEPSVLWLALFGSGVWFSLRNRNSSKLPSRRKAIA